MGEAQTRLDSSNRRGADPVELFTIQEVISRCRLGRTLLYEEIGSGRLRVVRFGRAVRVRSDDLTSWIADRTNATND